MTTYEERHSRGQYDDEMSVNHRSIGGKECKARLTTAQVFCHNFLYDMKTGDRDFL